MSEKLTAAEVKDALRGRHDALGTHGGPGPWTCLEEWANIDLVCFSAWSSAKPPIVGYEVKVGRSDYRRELLKPSKRALAVAHCYAFYFATPKGLLTTEEKAYVQPEHFDDGSAFVRTKCPKRCSRWKRNPYLEEKMTEDERAARRLTGEEAPVPIAFGEAACLLDGSRWDVKDEVKGEVRDPSAEGSQSYRFASRQFKWIVCDECEGRGYLRKSVVEEEAPTLWIPPDVGLVEVGSSGVRTIRKAPIVPPTAEWDLNKLVRWASYRPDPRHAYDNSLHLQAVA